MSAFNIATLLLFPGLGLVALAIGLLARRFSRSALVVGLTGLLTLTTASTWITASGPITDTTQIEKLTTDNAKLKVAVAGRQAELDDARKRPGEPAKVRETLTPERQSPDAKVAPNEIELAKRELTEALQKADDAAQRAAAATVRMVDLGEKVREAQNGRADAERRIAILEEKLRGVEPKPSPPAPQDLPSIRRKLADGDLPYYAARLERELIPGRRGAWYVVRLLRGGRDWNFADRQFALPDATEIKISATRLRDDVLLPLTRAGQTWTLFVRGAADARPISGPVGRQLSYLPRLSDGTHSPEPRGKQVAFPVQNEELPTLRADWLREIVRPLVGDLGKRDIEILENPPMPGHDRTAELVLFVEW